MANSYKGLQKQLENLQKDISEVKTKVAAIEAHVSNHLVHRLDELKSVFEVLDGRVKPLETKYAKAIGVSEFLSLILKGATALAALTWTGLQIIKFFTH